uniref:Uncharacterized protein n=1 Tax=Candidatus Kentrum sp. TC TaxID=2126339 RepID=A0A450Z0K0_9GAMM|nr:MAG: hypothetical protein BECKTC1821D_GA0114238_10448 [Candidatus Kentron sp. TC]
MAIETESLNKQELSEYCRKGGLYVEQINGIRQRPFFKKQFSKSRENREGDVEMGAVGKQPIHIGYSLIDLNLGADRTEAAFACSGDVSNLIGMVGTNISGIAESFRLSMVHDLPNIVSSGKTSDRWFERNCSYLSSKNRLRVKWLLLMVSIMD